MPVLIGDPRTESAQAVKDKLMDKFNDKGRIMSRLPGPILPGSQNLIRRQPLRCCASMPHGFWLQTMSPNLTNDAASWYTSHMRG